MERGPGPIIETRGARLPAVTHQHCHSRGASGSRRSGFSPSFPGQDVAAGRAGRRGSPRRARRMPLRAPPHSGGRQPSPRHERQRMPRKPQLSLIGPAPIEGWGRDGQRPAGTATRPSLRGRPSKRRVRGDTPTAGSRDHAEARGAESVAVCRDSSREAWETARFRWHRCRAG